MKHMTYPIMFGIFFLSLWEMIVRIAKIPSYILPSPTEIIAAVWTKKIELLFNTGITVFESLSGCILAVVIGIFVGILFSKSEKFRLIFYPYSMILQTIPAIVIGPLLIIWLGNGMIIKILLAMILSIFPVITNTYSGLSNTPFHFIDLFKILRASERYVWIKVKAKFALPNIFHAIRIGIGLSFIGALVGEFLGANKGLGSMILISSYHLDTSVIFAATASWCAVILLIMWIIDGIESKLLFWHEGIGRRYATGRN